MKIMVTGSDGQLGSELVKKLGNDAFPVPHRALDITDRRAVKRFFQFERPDAIVNCAAYTNVNKAEYRDAATCHAVNTTGVANLLLEAKSAVFVQISTDYVFDGSRRVEEYTERSDRNPLNIYGKSKRAAENLVKEYERYYILRTSGLFTNGHRNFVTNILSQAREGKPIRAVTDQVAHLTYAPHLASVIVWFVYNQPRYGIYHTVNRGWASWYEHAETILRLGGYTNTIEPVNATAFGGASRPPCTKLSTGKLEQLYSPMPSRQDGLREFFERENCGSTRN
jgi:dTDP-4-dehydrorhamnose reductase